MIFSIITITVAMAWTSMISLNAQTGADADKLQRNTPDNEVPCEWFLDPLVQPMIARDKKGLFDFAKEADWATLESVSKEMATEIRRVKQTVPVEILWKLRFMAANSVIMQEEMIREAGFWEEGDLDKTDFEESRDFMRDLYSEITIELQKRGEL